MASWLAHFWILYVLGQLGPICGPGLGPHLINLINLICLVCKCQHTSQDNYLSWAHGSKYNDTQVVSIPKPHTYPSPILNTDATVKNLCWNFFKQGTGTEENRDLTLRFHRLAKPPRKMNWVLQHWVIVRENGGNGCNSRTRARHSHVSVEERILTNLNKNEGKEDNGTADTNFLNLLNFKNQNIKHQEDEENGKTKDKAGMTQIRSVQDKSGNFSAIFEVFELNTFVHIFDPEGIG
ncbi:hypothetical protein ACP275_07G118200 [Erythranthe tilingii]